MEFKRTTLIQVFQNTNQITHDDQTVSILNSLRGCLKNRSFLQTSIIFFKSKAIHMTDQGAKNSYQAAWQ